MAELNWGIKRSCNGCGERYYDLKKTPPTCPKCGVIADLGAPVKGKRGRPSLKAVLPVDDLDLSDDKNSPDDDNDVVLEDLDDDSSPITLDLDDEDE